MESEILISVNELSRYYGQQRAIENVSFNVHRGEILGFLGPNGAGKSTTMQIISGILAASHGSVTVAGHDINEAAKTAKQYIGFLPEQPPLYTDLTVDEYLRYTARLRGISTAATAEAVNISKTRCGLEDVGTRLINNLSKGFKQRVGIAQAIIHAPDVIILDEPTSGLDPRQIIEIRDLMRELAQDHSVILSTHILSEVQSLCDRVLIINQGNIILDEKLETLQQQGDRTKSVVIGLRRPPANAALLAIDGIEQCEQIDTHMLRLTFSDGIDATGEIVQQAASENWGLFKLNPDDDSLESLFLRLTYGGEETDMEVGADE